MGHVDRPPDLVEELRSMKAQIHELQQRVRAAAFLSPVIARVSTSTVSIPNVTNQTISFTTEQEDTADLWDPGLPDRLTIPRAGMYILVGYAQFSNSSAVGDRQASVIAPLGQSGFTAFRSSTISPKMTPASIAKLEAGDIVQLSVFQDSGGALDLTFGALAVAWVGVDS